MSQLTELIEKAKKQEYRAMEVFNAKGKDLVFKGVELVRLENSQALPIDGLPLNGSIRIYMTDKNKFVLVDDRNLEVDGPMVLESKHNLSFGFYGYDRVAKELYKQLGIDSYLYI